MDDKPPEVSPRMIDLCKGIVQLCKDAGCYSVDLKIHPPGDDGYIGQIQLQWHRGRHDVTARCEIVTELRTRIEV